MVLACELRNMIELELGQHIGQGSGVGSCHFLEFSEVGGNLARDILRGAGSMPIVK